MSITPTVVLFADDPEMQAIQDLLKDCSVPFVHAIGKDGRRVTPANAYEAAGATPPLRCVQCGNEVNLGDPHGCSDPQSDRHTLPTLILVEGDIPSTANFFGQEPIRIDHHRPGDPGFTKLPNEFLPGSSLGQVLMLLARMGKLDGLPPGSELWQAVREDACECVFLPYKNPINRGVYVEVGWWYIGFRTTYGEELVHAVSRDHVLAAAGDHCPAAAYRGECPGVDPDALMFWRAETRAKFQKRSVSDVLADVDTARAALDGADARGLQLWRGFCIAGYIHGGGGRMNTEGDYLDPEVAYVEAEKLCGGALGYENAYGICPIGRSETVLTIPTTIHELPEAALRTGVAYETTVTERDGRRKLVLGGHTTPRLVELWLREQKLAGRETYGNPTRGYAGAYLKGESK